MNTDDKRYDVGTPENFDWEEAKAFFANAHDSCKMFPKLQPDELQELYFSIKENGQQDDIVFWRPDENTDPQLVDGRHRGVVMTSSEDISDPNCCLYTCDERSIVEWVWSKNYNRRHLDSTDRANLVLSMGGLREKMPVGRKAEGAESITDAAKQVGVSRATVNRRKRTLNEGGEKLNEAVDSKDIDVSTAEKAATSLNEDGQSKLVDMVADGASPKEAIEEVSKDAENIKSPEAMTPKENANRRVKAIIEVEIPLTAEILGGEGSPSFIQKVEEIISDALKDESIEGFETRGIVK